MVCLAMSHVDFFYGDTQILGDVTFELREGQRLGVVGRNGAGKTTLFRLLSGQLHPDGGHLLRAEGLSVGVLSQIPEHKPDATAEDVLRSAFDEIDKIQDELRRCEAELQKPDPPPALLARYDTLLHRLDFMGGYQTDLRLRKIKNGMGLGEALCRQTFDSLSGGEQTRVSLARLLLYDPDILLLDEPTNHLDMAATEWLEVFLSGYPGTVAVISHDRWFLDRVTTATLELDNARATLYPGNYSFYAQERALRRRQLLAKHEREERERRRLMDVARRMHDYAGKSDKLHRRAFAIEKRAARIEHTERPRDPKRIRAGFTAADFSADDVLRLQDLGHAFEGRWLFRHLKLSMRGGERIGIIGDNGAGKTTLLKLITGELTPAEGGLWTGPSVRPGYLPQVVTFDHPERTLVDTLVYAGATAEEARSRLGAFLFSGEDAFKRVGDLSGGEKSRLRLCLFMREAVNLLILDEPTNHLDIAGRDWLEDSLSEFDENLLFVSHDRYFVSRFATRLWVFTGGTVRDFQGGYADYLEWRRKNPVPDTDPSGSDGPRATPAAKASPAKTATGTDTASGPDKGRGQSGRGSAEEARRERARLRELMAQIEAAESRLSALDHEINQAATDPERLMALIEEQDLCRQERDRLYTAWETLERA